MKEGMKVKEVRYLGLRNIYIYIYIYICTELQESVVVKTYIRVNNTHDDICV